MHDLSIIDDIQTHQHEFDFVEKTERETLIKARIGQGRFREDVFNIWKGCAITGIKDPDLLIASHIKPWRLCTNNERLDAANGLMLLPHYDHLFDKGYLSFENNGNIIFSEILSLLPIEKIGINKNDKLVRRLNSPYLEFHRDEILIRKHKFY
jgi:predicted restriction endonuclease